MQIEQVQSINIEEEEKEQIKEQPQKNVEENIKNKNNLQTSNLKKHKNLENRNVLNFEIISKKKENFENLLQKKRKIEKDTETHSISHFKISVNDFELEMSKHFNSEPLHSICFEVDNKTNFKNNEKPNKEIENKENEKDTFMKQFISVGEPESNELIKMIESIIDEDPSSKNDIQKVIEENEKKQKNQSFISNNNDEKNKIQNQPEENKNIILNELNDYSNGVNENNSENDYKKEIFNKIITENIETNFIESKNYIPSIESPLYIIISSLIDKYSYIFIIDLITKYIDINGNFNNNQKLNEILTEDKKHIPEILKSLILNYSYSNVVFYSIQYKKYLSDKNSAKMNDLSNNLLYDDYEDDDIFIIDEEKEYAMNLSDSELNELDKGLELMNLMNKGRKNKVQQVKNLKKNIMKYSNLYEDGFFDEKKIYYQKGGKVGMHYHVSEKDGKIYKYYSIQYNNDGSVGFKCTEPGCKSKAVLIQGTHTFNVITPHMFDFKQHKKLHSSYLRDKFIKIMLKKKLSEIQLTKRDDKKVIEWYK